MLLLFLWPAMLWSGAVGGGGPFGGDAEGELLKVCSLGSESTEHLLADALIPCADKSDCTESIVCVSAIIAKLTQESPCDSRVPISGGFCNRAGTALVLVETLRQLLEAALREEGEAESAQCPHLPLLLQLFQPCRPETVDEGTLSYYQSLKVDAYAMLGYQNLMRGVGDRLRFDEGIASEMRWVEEQRLWRGAAAIGFSFACPGLVALISPSHLPMIVTVELLGAVVMLCYVWWLHGLWLALGALGVCGGVFVAQTGLLLIRRRLLPFPDPIEENDACPASPRLKPHRH